MSRAGRAEAAGAAIVAPAKINLYLHVLGRRPDGYHLLDSLIAFAAVHDRLSVAAGDDLSLEIVGPFAAPLRDESDNLVLRAARLLAHRAGVRPRARLVLDKRLPVASGIGGGSADAAATLRLLAAFWELPVTEAELAALGLEVGADVPVCLGGRAAYVGGVGEQIEPAPPLPPAGLVLVNPGTPVATAQAFRGARLGGGEPPRFREPCADAAALAARLRERRNDLAAAAVAVAPEIADARTALERLPGCLFAGLSGSGATCFGLFADEAAAKRAAGRLARAAPRWWVAPSRLISDYAELADG